MKQLLWAAVMAAVIVTLGCDALRDEKPLLLDGSEPLFLLDQGNPELANLPPPKGPVADNSRCFVCHMNYFQEELAALFADYVGRPSPIFHARRLSEQLGGAQIYLKREDLNHTGAHKINNCIGQILLAKRMGKKRIIAETGAGMHGVATATVAARFGMQCVVYMGTTAIERQQANVFRMTLLGAEVIPVTASDPRPSIGWSTSKPRWSSTRPLITGTMV